MLITYTRVCDTKKSPILGCNHRCHGGLHLCVVVLDLLLKQLILLHGSPLCCGVGMLQGVNVLPRGAHNGMVFADLGGRSGVFGVDGLHVAQLLVLL